MAKSRGYKNLIVWKKSMRLAKLAYFRTKKLPKREIYAITDQIRRAAISIPSNISEGYNRFSEQEFIHFLKIARGSLGEVDTQLSLCEEVGYLTKTELKELYDLIDEIDKMLISLILNTEMRIKEGNRNRKPGSYHSLLKKW